jgi:hypothetical protein
MLDELLERLAPPRLEAHHVVVHGAGVDHFLSCSGWVQAIQTSSGGTSTILSRTDARNDDRAPLKPG